jgi:GNAT superfamily N-acetyltransferase
LQALVARYEGSGYRPVLRLPDLPQWAPAYASLQACGFQRSKPTCVMAGALADLLQQGSSALPTGAQLALAAQASADWSALFVGEGFDPVDGASRAAALARARGTLFGSVQVQDRLVACGAGCYAEGLLGVHGMRTLPGHRAQGLATALLTALAQQALAQGMDTVFLQVEAGNPAQTLYQRLGLVLQWRYHYWQRGGGVGAR